MGSFAHNHLRILVFGDLAQNFKNSVLVLVFDAFSLIIYYKHYFFVFLIVFYINVDPISLICVVYSILYDITGYLLKPVGVADNMPGQILILFLVF